MMMFRTSFAIYSRLWKDTIRKPFCCPSVVMECSCVFLLAVALFLTDVPCASTPKQAIAPASNGGSMMQFIDIGRGNL